MKEVFNLTYLGLFPLGKSSSGKGMGIKMNRKVNSRVDCRVDCRVDKKVDKRLDRRMRRKTGIDMKWEGGMDNDMENNTDKDGKTLKTMTMFVTEEDGMGTVEIILIIVVLVGLVIIFKDQITKLVNSIFGKITSQTNKI